MKNVLSGAFFLCPIFFDFPRFSSIFHDSIWLIISLLAFVVMNICLTFASRQNSNPTQEAL